MSRARVKVEPRRRQLVQAPADDVDLTLAVNVTPLKRLVVELRGGLVLISEELRTDGPKARRSR